MVNQRARSVDDKEQRSEDILEAAESLALERGGVRFITLAPVTSKAGLHRTGLRRYYASKEELLLELAERGWQQWRDAVVQEVRGATNLSPRETARVMASTIASLPVFCDLLTHVTLSLEGDVSIERARRYKLAAFNANDDIVAALGESSSMDTDQVNALLPAALAFAASFWQVAHPTPSLAELYQQVPAWGHAALDFEPRLRYLLEATAVGIASPVATRG